MSENRIRSGSLRLISKKGQTIPYLVITCVSVLILTTGLIGLVNFSANIYANKQNETQASINATSAVSFAQGILAKDASSKNMRSFYLTGTQMPDKSVSFTCVYGTPPAGVSDLYATVTYDSITGDIGITAKKRIDDKSYDKNLIFDSQYINENKLVLQLENVTALINNASDGSTIAKNQSLIDGNISTLNKAVSLKTNFITIGGGNNTLIFSATQNRDFRILRDNSSFIPVLLKSPVNIKTYNPSGKLMSQFTLGTGLYYFNEGSSFDSQSAWVYFSGEDMQIIECVNITSGINNSPIYQKTTINEQYSIIDGNLLATQQNSITVITDYLNIDGGNKTLTFEKNKQVKFKFQRKNANYIPVVLNTPLIIKQTDNGQVVSTFTLQAGNYLFISGNATHSRTSWIYQTEPVTAVKSFTGGVYKWE